MTFVHLEEQVFVLVKMSVGKSENTAWMPAWNTVLVLSKMCINECCLLNQKKKNVDDMCVTLLRHTSPGPSVWEFQHWSLSANKVSQYA